MNCQNKLFCFPNLYKCNQRLAIFRRMLAIFSQCRCSVYTADMTFKVDQVKIDDFSSRCRLVGRPANMYSVGGHAFSLSITTCLASHLSYGNCQAFGTHSILI